MLDQGLILCLREAAWSILLKQPLAPKDPQECFLNLPCNCVNPGKELECEECPHLEGCLSQFKSSKSSGRQLKLSVKNNKKIAK
jgi:hypothetical protein